MKDQCAVTVAGFVAISSGEAVRVAIGRSWE